MSRIYFTADLHLGHELVAVQRGYDTVADHDAAIIETIIDALPDQTTLWILGDVMGWGSHREHALDLLHEVRKHTGATLHLVAGNHDTCHPMHRNAGREQRKYLRVFDSVQAFAKLRHHRRDVLLSHFPYHGDHTAQDRCIQWRLRDYGQPLIHGHTHQAAPTDESRPQQVCVSWEAWGRPAKLHEVMRALPMHAGATAISKKDPP